MNFESYKKHRKSLIEKKFFFSDLKKVIIFFLIS